MLKCVKQICIILFVSLISSFLGYSQEGISVGGPFGNINSKNKFSLVKNGELLNVFQTQGSCVLQKFDSKQNLAFVNEYDEFPKGFEINNVIEWCLPPSLFTDAWSSRSFFSCLIVFSYSTNNLSTFFSMVNTILQ